ncbi:hypothetical protein K437DRAFT_71643 [Tilletiaria anomala UBC 951]|uniref:Uncharacterized protein n=1 Tax=Tilletiaria anomala (strain ATCC 24038 / CBS 436.72 / UBC 951) TaxID=1037660 RepID=A0A066WHH5_TILAU|nr:uncharacterized protein K437DRAFT_71643 [Tilletiaria anomala UBC 951]KDN53437.1 hypothetical protein K437DRAFT_71643 [Tilletiaria anomala UBC 951]
MIAAQAARTPSKPNFTQCFERLFAWDRGAEWSYRQVGFAASFMTILSVGPYLAALRSLAHSSRHVTMHSVLSGSLARGVRSLQLTLRIGMLPLFLLQLLPRLDPSRCAVLAMAAQEQPALMVLEPSTEPAQCGLTQLRWSGSVGQSTVDLIDPHGNTLLFRFDKQPNNTFSLTWAPIKQPAGTKLVVRVTDSRPLSAAGSVLTIANSSDSSCLDSAALQGTPGSNITDTSVPQSSTVPGTTCPTSSGVTPAPGSSSGSARSSGSASALSNAATSAIRSADSPSMKALCAVGFALMTFFLSFMTVYR